MATRDGGGAWRSFTSKQVLGARGAHSLLGMFGTSDRNANEKEKQVLEAEEQEAKARNFGGLVWSNESIPAPDFVVVPDEVGPSCRADLSVCLQSENEAVKEVRFLGPRRASVAEARKDGSELRRIAFVSAQSDPTLTALWKRCCELGNVQWTAEQLVGDDVEETAEQQLPDFKAQQPLKKEHFKNTKEWFQANEKKKSYEQKFAPVGPSWALTQTNTPVPKQPGVWFMHERQDKDGKHYPLLYFNASTGKYYRNRSLDAAYSPESSKWVQTGQPNQPADDSFMKVVHGSACFPNASGRKDDMAVILPELARTGSLLKQPLPFAHKPASLFLLVDGLRDSNSAAEWCAKRFHTQIIPRLSACHTEPEDYELVTMVKESLEKLDHALLEGGARYAGCNIALALVLGPRVLVCSVGACRAFLCTPQQETGVKRSNAPGASAKKSVQKWSTRPLAGNIFGHTAADVQETERRRRLEAYAPLDFDGQTGEQLAAVSAKEEVLASQSLSDRERAVKKVLQAAHPFAALGLTVAEAVATGPTAGQKAVDAFQATVGPSQGEPLVEAALNRVKVAGEAVDKMLSQDAFGTQQLGELFYAMDEEDGIMSPQRAAALLGVQTGCGEAIARSALEMRYQAILTGLAATCPADAARGWDILGEVADAAARPAATAIWTPPVGSRAVEVGRAMGLRDLKRPRKLVGVELVCEVVHFEPGSSQCLVLITDGAQNVTEDQIADAVSQNKGRPKAACLQIASTAIAEKQQQQQQQTKLTALAGEDNSKVSGASTMIPSVGALAAFLTMEEPEDPNSSAAQEGGDPKKRKAETALAQPATAITQRVRIAHILIKWESLTTPDPMTRRPPPKGRTQVDAEKQLLKVLQILDQVPHGGPDSGKKLTAKFAELAKKHSDCKSADSGALADLGWIHPGEWGGEFEVVAFDLPVGGISDVLVTPRGVLVIHRLA